MKRKSICLLILIIFLILNNHSGAQAEGDVYVIPIKGEINRATFNFLEDNLEKIVKYSPKAIIFEIDTYGGLVNEAEKIKNLIIGLDDIQTISFVNTKAESAGVLITVSSERVVMSESSTIGSAETIPDTEKVLSMWRSFLRDVGQLRGRNPEILEAMADKDIHIEELSKKGKLLNLTSREALKYGISDLIANDYTEILDNFNISYGNIVKIDENLELKVAKLLSSPYINTILLTLGFMGLVIEIFTPGFGLAGSIGVIAFGLFFGGNIIAGKSQWTSLIIFATGLILLVIEAIVPGFGLPGVSGIIFVILGIVLAMGSFTMAIMSLSIAIILATIVIILFIKYGHKSPLFDKIVLLTHQKDEEGYVSSNPKLEYLDKEGVAITGLRPSGIIEIDGNRLDALSDGIFIPKDAKIRVIRVEGSKIIVRRVS